MVLDAVVLLLADDVRPPPAVAGAPGVQSVFFHLLLLALGHAVCERLCSTLGFGCLLSAAILSSEVV